MGCAAARHLHKTHLSAGQGGGPSHALYSPSPSAGSHPTRIRNSQCCPTAAVACKSKTPLTGTALDIAPPGTLRELPVWPPLTPYCFRPPPTPSLASTCGSGFTYPYHHNNHTTPGQAFGLESGFQVLRYRDVKVKHLGSPNSLIVFFRPITSGSQGSSMKWKSAGPHSSRLVLTDLGTEVWYLFPREQNHNVPSFRIILTIYHLNSAAWRWVRPPCCH